MSRNIMSIGRIMYSKMPTKRKLSDFYGLGLPSNTIKWKAKISFRYKTPLLSFRCRPLVTIIRSRRKYVVNIKNQDAATGDQFIPT